MRLELKRSPCELEKQNQFRLLNTTWCAHSFKHPESEEDLNPRQTLHTENEWIFEICPEPVNMFHFQIERKSHRHPILTTVPLFSWLKGLDFTFLNKKNSANEQHYNHHED